MAGERSVYMYVKYPYAVGESMSSSSEVETKFCSPRPEPLIFMHLGRGCYLFFCRQSSKRSHSTTSTAIPDSDEDHILALISMDKLQSISCHKLDTRRQRDTHMKIRNM